MTLLLGSILWKNENFNLKIKYFIRRKRRGYDMYWKECKDLLILKMTWRKVILMEKLIKWKHYFNIGYWLVTDFCLLWTCQYFADGCTGCTAGLDLNVSSAVPRIVSNCWQISSTLRLVRITPFLCPAIYWPGLPQIIRLSDWEGEGVWLSAGVAPSKPSLIIKLSSEGFSLRN